MRTYVHVQKVGKPNNIQIHWVQDMQRLKQDNKKQPRAPMFKRTGTCNVKL